MTETVRPMFLFLNCQEYADVWIGGGLIPLNPARNYRSELREGTMTPDEVVQKQIKGASMRDFEKARINISNDATVTRLAIVNSLFQDEYFEHAEFSQHPEEALILCLSTSPDPEIMARLGHSFCVEIPDVGELKRHLDEKVGAVSGAGEVQYTAEQGNRHHFLKSTKDEWQREYRLVWVADGLGTEPCWVAIPPGLAHPAELA